MSRLFEELRIEPTVQRLYDSFESVKAHVEKTDALFIEANFREQYRLIAVVAIEFSANRADYEHAKMAAKKLLVQQFYGETLAYLSKLEHTMYSGNREDCVSIIAELRTVLMDVR